jgi:hypothetical protein
MNCAAIFGGTGFIGFFFARFLLEAVHFNTIYLIDIDPLNSKSGVFRKNIAPETLE